MGRLELTRPTRSFVALPCPAAIREAIRSACEEWRVTGADIRWSDPQNLHLTIRFLGDADPGRLERLDDGLRETCRASQAILARAGVPGAFPDWSRPRVLWLSVESDGAIESLARSIEGVVRGAGFAPEERPFTPHLTLGRVRGSRGLRRAKNAVSGWRPRVVPQEMSEVVLFRSELGSGGARHFPLARYPLQEVGR